ncbi:helix-turn-helix domain-containing protein [Roseomonas sp. AR75]|uniref:helix-turn-helix domain-containing protein n=1 Tax=Roseomonas sp. AR75 TaxID=2562311 RepID=UPI0010C09D77|nr:helix-turn-helix domain-containing protein [Roseomonas sp. AR75]
MLSPFKGAPPLGFDLSTGDHDEFAASLLGGSFDCTALPGGPFHARLRILCVGDMVVQHGENGAHAMRGAMAHGVSALVVPLQYLHGPARMNGSEVLATEAFLAPGGVEFNGHTPGRHAWGALAVPTSRMESWLELAQPAIRERGEASVLAIPPAAAADLLHMLSSAAEMAARMPEALFEPGCAQCLADSLGDAMLEAMTGGAVLLPRGRAAREAQRVVRAAEDFLRAQISRPIYREHLCAALGVSLRKLHDAFIATVGVSPQVYLKTRRLVLVRRALRQAADRKALVKSVALAHGFWHLGHFARDYRMMFGESPSVTVDAALARGAPRSSEAARAA